MWRRRCSPARIPTATLTDPRTQMRAVFRDGLLPALQIDAVVLRAFVRNLNMLSPPDALLGDADVGARVFAAWEARANRPPAPTARAGDADRVPPTGLTRSSSSRPVLAISVGFGPEYRPRSDRDGRQRDPVGIGSGRAS